MTLRDRKLAKSFESVALVFETSKAEITISGSNLNWHSARDDFIHEKGEKGSGFRLLIYYFRFLATACKEFLRLSSVAAFPSTPRTAELTAEQELNANVVAISFNE